MSLRLLSLFASLVLATANAGAQSVLKGHHLDNDKIGFYGFCVDIPMNYEAFTPDATKDAPAKTYAQAAWVTSASFDKHAGFTTQERIPFSGPNRGLVVLVARCSASFPPVKKEAEYLRALDILMSWCVSRSKDDVIRDIRKIGDIHVGRVALSSQGNFLALNMVMIPPTTLLVFYVAGPSSQKDDLLADLDATIATLNIGKKGPHS